MSEKTLKTPESVAPVGAVRDAGEAYIRSVIALPELLESIADSLAGLLYIAEKVAVRQKLISEEELKEIEVIDEEPGD